VLPQVGDTFDWQTLRFWWCFDVYFLRCFDVGPLLSDFVIFCWSSFVVLTDFGTFAILPCPDLALAALVPAACPSRS
jgi:hypothetical protein